MSGRKKVLVIDGDSDTCGLITEVLGAKGFEVFSSADPDEGVTKAGEILPDLVFISILFPGSNGLKISRAVHSVDGLQGTPVIMLISYADELDPKYTSTIGIVDVAIKPLDAEQILLKTTSVLGEGAAPEDSGEMSADVPEVGGPESASLDEEWMSFLEKGDSETAGPGAAETEAPHVPEPEYETRHVAGITEGSSDGAADVSVTAEHDAGEAVSSEDMIDLLRAETQERSVPADEGEYGQISDAPQGRSMKKFLVIASVVLAIAVVAGVGAYRFFQGQKSKIVTAAAKTSAQKAPIVETKNNGVSSEKKEAVTQTPSVETAATATPAAPKKTAEGKTAAMAEKAGKESYSVQVGVFRNGNNAAALTGTLKKKGYDAFVLTDAGGQVHRVLIGKYDTRGAAAVEAKRVLEREGLKTIVYRH